MSARSEGRNCRFYPLGTCLYGPQCRFNHDKAEEPGKEAKATEIETTVAGGLGVSNASGRNTRSGNGCRAAAKESDGTGSVENLKSPRRVTRSGRVINSRSGNSGNVGPIRTSGRANRSGGSNGIATSSKVFEHSEDSSSSFESSRSSGRMTRSGRNSANIADLACDPAHSKEITEDVEMLDEETDKIVADSSESIDSVAENSANEQASVSTEPVSAPPAVIPTDANTNTACSNDVANTGCTLRSGRTLGVTASATVNVTASANAIAADAATSAVAATEEADSVAATGPADADPAPAADADNTNQEQPSTSKNISLKEQMDELKKKLKAISVDKSCGICMETISNKPDPQFGLLPNCIHIFCLDCIKRWRQQTYTDVDHHIIKCCPHCRIHSEYVCPSYYYAVDKEDKEILLQNHRMELSTIHCRKFRRGDGQCPHGDQCFYKHVERSPDEPRSTRAITIRRSRTSRAFHGMLFNILSDMAFHGLLNVDSDDEDENVLDYLVTLV